jgi:DNA-binding NarL/FixJ family response regulator
MGSTRVLIVDDDALLVQALCEVLDAQAQVDVIDTATCGEEAVEKAHANPPDIVLIDLMMPGIGGIEATHRIHTACPAAKVIVLTGCCDPGQARQALAAGAHGYLIKTCGIQAIGQAIRGAVEGVVQVDPQVVAALAERPVLQRARTPCPLLGVEGRPDLQCSYASRQHCCFARPRKARPLDVQSQNEWCLSGRHLDCAEYKAWEARQDAAEERAGSVWQRLRRAPKGS